MRMTETGRAPGPLEMHHHRVTPDPTPAQRRVIETNRKAARARRSGEPSTTVDADPFALCQPDETPDPFGS